MFALDIALEAHELVGNHLPTVKTLQTSVAKGFGAGADLAQLNRKQWLTLAKAVGGKDGKDLPAGAVSVEAYADSLGDGVEPPYPTQVVAHALLADKKPVRRAVGQVLQAKPDGIFNALFSRDLAAFVREADLRGLLTKDMVVAGLLTGEPEYLEPLGAEAPQGWIVTGYPWWAAFDKVSGLTP